MANLKEIRTRIASVNSTKQITSAMKMVAAAKLNKAQNAIIQLRPYVSKLHEIITGLLNNADVLGNNPYARNSKAEKLLFIVITSNKGLCGTFNSNSVKIAYDFVHENYEQQFQAGNIDFITIGKKAYDLFKTRKIKILERYDDLLNSLNFLSASEFANTIMKKFRERKYDHVFLVYNEFKNVAVQNTVAEQYLPIQLAIDENQAESDFIYEPNKEQIIEQMIPYALKIQFYKALLESNASEHGARMTAMHKATDNAVDLLKELRITYNKERQAAITNEILEIVGGAEALKNK